MGGAWLGFGAFCLAARQEDRKWGGRRGLGFCLPMIACRFGVRIKVSVLRKGE